MTRHPISTNPAAVADLTRRSTPVGRRGRLTSLGVALLGPLLVVALSACRSPEIMLKGHLWAEDSVFLTHTLATGSLLSKIFYVYNGHLELLNSIVFAAASDFRLKMIPLVTTYCGLLIECTLAFLVVLFRTDIGIGLLPALLVDALVVVSPCATEHQLNMLNSVWVTSAILLLLINLPPRRLERHMPGLAATSLILGLSGISATCLMPVAMLHAAAWRSRPHLLVAATLVLCGLIQGVLVLTHGTPNRFGSVSPWVYLAAPFFHIVLEHLMGVEAVSALTHWFQQSLPDTTTILSLMLAPLALLGWMAARLVGGEDSRSRLLLATVIYVALFNIAFAIGDRNDLFSIYGMRYFFVPSFALGLLLARSATAGPRRPARFLLGLLVFVTVLSAKDFFVDGYNGAYVTPERDWRRDVADCQARGSPCRVEIDPGGYYAVEVPGTAVR